MTKKKITTEPASGTVLDIPLSRMKKSPRNARKVPHPKPDIEALAASIAANGMLQNPVVEPERDQKGKPTGFYLVTIGEGRRQAQLLRAKRKEITKAETIRCVVDTTHDALEISLAENAIRSPMHPADQFEAFHELHRDHGLSAEDIAARFGVTPAVVRQRLKLAAISPALLTLYREGEMNLDQLTAFAICDDHARQEKVWDNLGEDAEREDILAALNLEHVEASDPRARFVGEEAYRAAGGGILHDLFDQEGEGFFTDPELLDRLADEKLRAHLPVIEAEGWKWIEVVVRHDHDFTSDMRRVYPQARELSDDDQATVDALEAEYDAFEGGEDDEAQEELARLEQAVEDARGEDVYDPEDIARGGAVLSLDRYGEPLIMRGFIRPEDDAKPQGQSKPARHHEGPAPLSDKLVAELTAHRTMALRDALAQNPQVALVATVHAFAQDAFYHAASTSCLAVSVRCPPLTQHAPGIEASASAQAIDARHECWAKRVPEDPADLWSMVASLTQAEQLELLAHCVARSVDAVLARASQAEDDRALSLAQAIGLDMAAHWQPTAANYFGRVAKERILDAVREAVSPEAADNIAKLKKQAMAEAAASRMRDRNWLPPILRTPMPLSLAAE